MQTSSNAPAATPPPAAKPTGRDAFIADMAAIKAKSAAPPPPAEEMPAATPTEDDVPVDPIALADGADPEDDDGELAAAPPAKPKEEAIDPAEARRLAAAQKDERQRKAKIDADRAALKAEHTARMAEVEAQRTTVAEEAKAAQEFKALRERAKSDPLAAIDLMRSLGYAENEFAALSHAAWAETPKGKADPRHRETAEKIARDREVGTTVAALQKQLDEFKASAKAEKEAAAAEQEVAGYLDAATEVAKTGKMTTLDDEGNEIVAATVDAPILKRWLASDGRAARAHMRSVAAEMYRANGEAPEPPDLIAEVEKRERIALRKRGIDPAALAKPPAPEPVKKPTPPPPGKTLARAGAAPATPKKKLTDEEIREEFIRGRQAGKFDD